VCARESVCLWEGVVPQVDVGVEGLAGGGVVRVGEPGQHVDVGLACFVMK